MANTDIPALVCVTETLITALQNAIKTNIFDGWISKSRLPDLMDKSTSIKNILLGIADDHKTNSGEILEFIKKIEDVVYDADDFFDEFLTLAERKQLAQDGKFCEKVHSFFSSPIYSCKMSSEIKKISKKLDNLINICPFEIKEILRLGGTSDSTRMHDDYRPITRERVRTGSFVDESSIIGREDDVEWIIDVLLDSRSYENFVVGCLPIVGRGGLGKTTLAQYVYNHDMVAREFLVRLWVHVGGIEKEGLEFVKEVLMGILGSLNQVEVSDLSLEMIHRRFGEDLQGKRFLLVLDDVWNVSETDLLNLKSYLNVGGPGSMILVTTRSKVTAKIMGTKPSYELKPFSDEISWLFFKRCAFSDDHEPDPDIVDIGKKIVESCSGHPLAIRVVGGILYGQKKSKWLSVLKGIITKVEGRHEDSIIPVLKLSYNNLTHPMKGCFSYCALFPKDFVIDKKVLINLWMAQGYIVDEGCGIQDDEYFIKFLNRSFFNEVERDEYGVVISCEIHDLLHDLALNVAGRQIICGRNVTTNDSIQQIRHLSDARIDCGIKTKIRTYLQTSSVHSFAVGALIASCTRLRALVLCGIERLPDSIGDLLHLRYLDLSKNNNLKALPNSVTKLLNLQTLNIDGCYGLKELPEDLSKLKRLRQLYVNWDGLTYMPPGMDKLTCLCVLTSFVVADKISSAKKCVGQLKDLRALQDLKGHINISIPENFADVMDDDKIGGVLQGMKHLWAVGILFQGRYNTINNEGGVTNHESLLGMLQPHSNLKGLTMSGYQGSILAMWGRDDSLAKFLPNLVRIDLKFCHGFEHLPSLSELKHLHSLKLQNLGNLKYIENTRSSTSLAAAAPEISSSSAESIFFPSLEQLELVNLPKLKRWLGEVDSVYNSADRNINWQSSFPRLQKLTVLLCPDLTSFPPCPNLVRLCLRGFNESLRIIVGEDHEGSSSASSHFPSVVQCGNSIVKLKEVEINDVSYIEGFQGSSAVIRFDWDEELENLPEAGEIE